MHGRVRVKTTAQQQEEKRIEKQKKLNLYNAAMEKIFAKRASLEYDTEILQITAQVLQNNPDDATLWNIRRDAFLKKKFAGEDIAACLKDELMLTQQALLKNPKSYGSWWHREWIMLNMCAEPNWENELKLCNLFLEKDDRNFHCWNYRRFILQHYFVPLEEELKFSRERIDANFSNYSSWHYRSYLLPQLYPAKAGADGPTIKESVLLEELELVLNAAFTDPTDQSAWMYHRWLLGNANSERRIMCAGWYEMKGYLLVSVTSEAMCCDVIVKADGNSIDVLWEPIGGRNSAFVWICKDVRLQHAGTINVSLESFEINLTTTMPQWHAFGLKHIGSGSDAALPTAAKTNVLEQQLDSARQLIEMEPDSKWPLLTVALLMCALCDPLKYYSKVLQTIDKLCAVDPARLGYYHDLRSRLVIEHQLQAQIGGICKSQFASPETPEDELNKTRADVAEPVLATPAAGNSALNIKWVGKRFLTLDFSSLGITCLRHCEKMCLAENLILSNNKLQDRFLFQLRHCAARLKQIDLDGNPIKSLQFLKLLPQLEAISLKGCDLEDITAISYCKSLKKIVVSSKIRDDFLRKLKDIPKLDVRVE